MFTPKTLSGGRMTKYKGRVASMSPVMGMAVSAIALGAGLANAQETNLYTIGQVDFGQFEYVVTGFESTQGESLAIFLIEDGIGAGYEFINDGDIDRDTDGYDEGRLDDPDVYNDAVGYAGIVVEGDLDGSITNNGSVDVAVSDLALDADAGGALAGVGINVGDRSQFLTDTFYYTEGTPVSQNNDSYLLTGTITNASSGVISVDVVSGGEAFAGGIIIEGDADNYAESGSGDWYEDGVSTGDIINDGVINVSATTNGDAYRNYNNLVVYGGNAGKDLTPDMEGPAYAVGIGFVDWSMRIREEQFQIGSTSEPVLDNLLTDEWFDPSRTMSLASGLISNTGSIRVEANGYSGEDASAIGIYLATIGSTSSIENVNDEALAEIDNSGIITVVSNGYEALGIGIGGEDFVSAGDIESNGRIRNSNMIAVLVNGSETASAYGISVMDIKEGGRIDNTGTVRVQVTSDDNVYVAGIAGEDLGGSIVNGTEAGLEEDFNGLISVYVEKDGDYTADIFGIELRDDVESTGLVANYGRIEIEAYATEGTDSIDIAGISTDNVFLGGSVLNAGTIDVYLSLNDHTEDSVEVYGMEHDYIAGVVRNTGTVRIEADVDDFDGSGDSDGFMAFAGMRVYDVEFDSEIEVAGLVENEGRIEISLYVSSGESDGTELYVAGMEAGGVYGNLINSGYIAIDVSVETDSSIGSMYVAGVAFEGVEGAGRVENSGTIDIDVFVEDIDEDFAVWGMRAYTGDWGNNSGNMDGDIAGLFVNTSTGRILINVTAEDTNADARGMEAEAVLEGGEFRNDGTINVYVESTESDAHADGMNIGDVYAGGLMVNTGNIIVQAYGSESSSAHGIWVGDSLDGELRNSGLVAAYTGDVGGEGSGYSGGENYAIYVDRGAGTVALETQGVLIGDLLIGDDSENGLTLLIESQQGHNVLWAFDAIPEDVVLDDEGGAPLVYLTGDDAPIIMSAESDSNRALAFGQLTGGAGAAAMGMTSGAVGANGAADVSRLAFMSSKDMAGGDVGYWFNASGASSTYEDVLGGFDQTVTTGSASIGIVGQAQNGMMYGFTAGALGFNSSASDSATQEARGGMIGATLAAALGPQATVTFGLFGGALQHEDERTIQHNWVYLDGNDMEGDGFETSSASYNSTFVTPSIELSFNSAIGASTTLVSSIGYSHSYISIDGYTESGVTNVFEGDMNATFGDQLLQIGEATFGLGIEQELAGGGTFLASLDYIQRNVIGDEVDVAVGDNDGTMSLASGTMNAFELGLGYRHVSGGVAFDIGASVMASDGGSYGYGMNLGINVDF